ncbi:NUDIX domain-containing protein [Candidatus Pacearchaeota archaeon]|nr:NUDIX domain-containing protein [Candidatus Pacearchaeota archaeon]
MEIKYNSDLAHYIVVTGILIKDEKYLIAKRAEWEKAFPGKWTVPGGKLKVEDYSKKEKDTSQHWYNVLEDVLRRELREEVGLDVRNLGYVTSMVYIRDDLIPCLIVSLYGEPVGDKIKLCNALTDYKWVNLEEAKNFDLVEGMYDELVMLDEFLKTGKHMIWKRK